MELDLAHKLLSFLNDEGLSGVLLLALLGMTKLWLTEYRERREMQRILMGITTAKLASLTRQDGPEGHDAPTH